MRGFRDTATEIFHITEVQSDLFQKIKQEPPIVRGASADFAAAETLKKYKATENLLGMIDENNWASFRESVRANVFQLTNQMPKNLKEAKEYVKAGKEYWAQEAYRADAPPASLLDASKYWYERVLREFNRRAAENPTLAGETLRIPVGETAAIIEGWPRVPSKWELPIQLTPGESLGPIRTVVGEDGMLTAKWDPQYGRRGGWVSQPGGIPLDTGSLGMKDFQTFKQKTGALEHTIAKEYEGLHRFYEKDVRKFVEKEWNAKEVTDEGGRKWMEWEVNRQAAGERVPMFGRLGPKGKQAGIIDLEGMEKLPENAKQAAEQAAKMANRASAAPRDGDKAGSDRVKKAWAASKRAAEAAQKVTLQKLYNSARDNVADHQGTLKRLLIEKGGEFGQQTVNRLNVLGGSVMRGKYIYETQAKPIFAGKTAEQLETLNTVVSMRNLIEAQRRQPRFESPDGITAADGQAFLRELMRDNPKEARIADRAADKVFEVYRGQLQQLREAGILSEENYNKVVSNNTLSEIVRLIDPEIPGVIDVVSEKIATSSGLPYIPIGKKGSMFSARALLSETIGRTQNRLMRNEAASALYKVAELNPDIGFMRTFQATKHDASGKAELSIPEGYMKIAFREEGKEKVVLMEKDLAEVWYNRPPALDSIVADVGRLVSGTSLVKALATSYNPLFPIAGVTMDAAHLFMSGRGYSSNLPIFIGQLAWDLAKVEMDAIKRGPRYQQAMMEGMGFDFMTHQGRDMWHAHSLEKQFNPKMERIKKGLSWINETAEIQIRLAHRERLISNGMAPWEATAFARDRLDYSQGGVMSKFADVFVPYSNVAVVAWHSALKEAARDPIRAANKLTWATGTIMGLTAINMMQDIEAWMDIPAQDKIGGIPVLIPDLTIIDSTGTKRVGYTNIRSDNVLAPLHALAVAVVEKQMTGKVSEGLVKKTLESLPSLLQGGGMQVPLLEAWNKYASNYDTRSDATIWTGMKVPPELEFKGPASQRPTSILFKELGELTGMSPERLDRASRSMLPNNPYLGGVNGIMKMALDVQDPSIRSKGTWEKLAQNENLSRIIKFTHPAHREVDQIDRAVEKYGAKVKPLYDTVDAYVVKFGQGEVTSKDFGAWISAQPPELQKQLSERFKHGATIDKAMREGHASEGIPSRVWWMKLAHEPAEVRAELYHEKWVSADGEERKRLDKMAGTLTAQGIGFASEDFKRYFSRAQQRFKDDQR